MALSIVREAIEAGVLATVLSGCETRPVVTSDALFRVAVNGAPGGSLLGVWGDDEGDQAFIVGGLVGVDRNRAPGRAGRLVEYGIGHFLTRCATDAVLWWAHGVRDTEGLTVFAVGEEGGVLRYRDRRCETLPMDLSWSEGPPTFWGVWARAADDVWMVGGSARPTGPRGVLVHFDGRAFSRVTDLPEAAQHLNLYKVTGVGSELVVVGEAGLVLRYDGQRWTQVEVPIRAYDNRVFTASCAGDRCFAVGGSNAGIVLQGAPTRWTVAPGFDDAPGINGVWAAPDGRAYLAGVGGFTALLDGAQATVPQRRVTEASLHGVGGFGRVVLAVGGELDEPSPAQRAVVLVRGDESVRFTFDGVLHQSAEALRASRGGSGQ